MTFKHRAFTAITAVFVWLARRLPDLLLVTIRERTGVRGRLDAPGKDIWLEVESYVEYRTRLRSCSKEPDTVRWIQGFAPGDVFYDIGANVGAYSLVAGSSFEGKVRVIAFEPGFPNFPQLCRNIALNGLQGTITALPLALSDRTEIASFHYSTLAPGGALHTLGDAIDSKGDGFSPVLTQSVVAFELDGLIDQFGLPEPTHIKIDVDGIEERILLGARATLAAPTVRSLLVELDGEPAAIVSMLGDLGFTIRGRWKDATGGKNVWNYEFARA